MLSMIAVGYHGNLTIYSVEMSRFTRMRCCGLSVRHNVEDSKPVMVDLFSPYVAENMSCDEVPLRFPTTDYLAVYSLVPFGNAPEFLPGSLRWQ